MMECWRKDPEDRPTFTQLRERLETIMQKDNLYLALENSAQSPEVSAPSVDKNHDVEKKNSAQLMTSEM